MSKHEWLLSVALVMTACGGSGGQAPSGTGGNGGGAHLPDPAGAPAMKTVFASNYLAGAAIPPEFTSGTNATVLIKHMSSLTAENAMKPDTIQPSLPNDPDQPSAQNFAPADGIVGFAMANNMKMRGHTLLWYYTAPSWFFAGCSQDPAGCLPDVRLRLKNYITSVVKHFGGQIYAWDVVNEVVNPDATSTSPYRTNGPWYQTYAAAKAAGANVEPWDYIEDAFRDADEARTSLGLTSADMKLMINEYNTELPGKRANLVKIIQDLRNKGVPIDGVGHQFHLRIDADVNEVTNALVAVENLGGLVNQVTELDVNVYADPPSCAQSGTGCIADYFNSPPQSVMSDEARLYRALYAAFKRPSVQSVTTWGLNDGHTWYNDIPGSRKNYPLLFDASDNPKWAFWAVVDSTIAIP